MEEDWLWFASIIRDMHRLMLVPGCDYWWEYDYLQKDVLKLKPTHKNADKKIINVLYSNCVYCSIF